MCSVNRRKGSVRISRDGGCTSSKDVIRTEDTVELCNAETPFQELPKTFHRLRAVVCYPIWRGETHARFGQEKAVQFAQECHALILAMS